MLGGLLDVIFPRRCEVTGLGQDDPLLRQAHHHLTPHPEICPVCRRPSEGGRVCPACRLTNPLPLDGIGIVFCYDDVIKRLILKLKLKGRYTYADWLASKLTLLLQTHPVMSKGPVVLTSVPSHWRRHYFVKGYNQSALLARAVSRHDGRYPYLSLVRKIRHTSSQLKLSRSQRLRNVVAAYALRRDATQLRQDYLAQTGKTWTDDITIIIVDDVTTTGSTFCEVARTIRQSFPQNPIRGLALARHAG